MKKKDAIERLAKELESRDQRQFEDATKAAGNAATVTPIIKDYKALAKEHMQRAETELAFERAMLQIEQRHDCAGWVKNQPLPPIPPAPVRNY